MKPDLSTMHIDHERGFASMAGVCLPGQSVLTAEQQAEEDAAWNRWWKKRLPYIRRLKKKYGLD